MAHTSALRRPGRPKDEGKRSAIIQAARRLFVESAYEAVTMEKVALAAGVAKMTLYSHFNDKESLFIAMVEANSDMMTMALPALPHGECNPEEELVAFGRAFLGVLLRPEFIDSMHRHSDMLARNRLLAERIYDAGPGRTRAALAAYLSGRVGAGLSAEDSIDAASDLMSLWLGDWQQRLALGLAAPVTQDKIFRHVRRCTRLFLRVYAK